MSKSPAPVMASSGSALAVSGAVSPRLTKALSRRGILTTSPATESLRTGGRAIESTAGLGLVGAGGSPAAESTQVFILASWAWTALSVFALCAATITAFAESEV